MLTLNSNFYKKIVKWQIVITIILDLLLLPTHNEFPVWSLSLIILPIILLFIKKYPVLKAWLNLLLLPLSFNLSLKAWLIYISDHWSAVSLASEFIFQLLSLFIFLPTIIVYAPYIKGTIARLLVTLIISYQNLFLYFIEGNVLSGAIKIENGLQGLVYGISALFALLLAGKLWGFKFNPNIKFSNQEQIFSSVVLILFSIWFCVFNAILPDVDNIQTAIWSWPSFFQNIQTVQISAFFGNLNNGITEEIMRYLNIIVLFSYFKNKKYRVAGPLFFSSLLFSLYHLWNLNFSNFPTVINQVIFVFPTGLLFGLLYLYTGKVWIPILIHTSYDFLISIIELNPLAVSGLPWIDSFGSRQNGIIIQDLINLTLTLLLTWLLLTGKRKQTILAHLNYLVS